MRLPVFLSVSKKYLAGNRIYNLFLFVHIFAILFLVILVFASCSTLFAPGGRIIFQNSILFLCIICITIFQRCSAVSATTIKKFKFLAFSYINILIGTNTDLNILLILVTKFYFLKIIEELSLIHISA